VEEPEIDQQVQSARDGNVVAPVGPFGNDVIMVRGPNLVPVDTAKVDCGSSPFEVMSAEVVVEVHVESVKVAICVGSGLNDVLRVCW
jgi:hypothetical protein